jgi:hypothetical protein
MTSRLASPFAFLAMLATALRGYAADHPRRLALFVAAILAAVIVRLFAGEHAAAVAGTLGAFAMAYPDPIAPVVDVNDYLRVQTQRIGTDTITWASGTATAPVRDRSRFVLPKVGLASRIYLDFDGASATAYDFTAGGGTGAVAAAGNGPYGIVDGITLSINGGSGWYDTTGFGTYLINAAEGSDRYPQDAPGTAYTTAPTDVASTIFDYPASADGRPRFGLEVPLALGPANPLGMILLQNDQTTVDLVVRWAALDKYAVLAGGASATLSITVTAVLEYFDIPPRDAFLAFFLPMLRWAHWWREERQDVAASGRDSNIVSLDNHDTYLRVIHYLIRNSILNTDNVTDLRFVLNRQHTLFDHDDATHLRRQRAALGKDLPAFVWDFFQTGTLRDAIHADAYTDIRSVLDIDSITGTCFVKTLSEKLVDLGEPIGGQAAAIAVAG